MEALVDQYKDWTVGFKELKLPRIKFVLKNVYSITKCYAFEYLTLSLNYL